MSVDPEGKQRIRVSNRARPGGGTALAQGESVSALKEGVAEGGEGVPVELVPPKAARKSRGRARPGRAASADAPLSEADRAEKPGEIPECRRDVLPPRPGREEERPSPVQVAVELLASGHSDIEALERLQQGEHQSLEQAGAALDAAYRRIAQAQERSGGQRLALALERRQRIAARAYAGEDYRIALTALEQHDKLLGLGDEVNPQGNQAATSLLQLLQRAAQGGGMTPPVPDTPEELFSSDTE